MAILPAKQTDPTSTSKLRAGAIRRFQSCLKKTAQPYIDVLDQIPVTLVVNKRYGFDVDSIMLFQLLQNAGDLIDEIFELNTPESFWFFTNFVQAAYQRGTSQEHYNLSHQSAVYAATYEDVAQVLNSTPYRRRLSLVRARIYEEMQGLTAQIKADMSRILTEGLARGQNPLTIASQLRLQTDLPLYRCKRIARTEITTALRRARMDEADEAEDSLGLMTRQMHISALSPTTRSSHAARHAKIYTTDQQRDWWSRDANSINCKCSTVTVLVDREGNVLNPGIVARAKENYRVAAEKYKDEWSD